MPRTVTGAQRTQGAKPPDRLDLKVCNCAVCGKECVGITHSEFSHHFGIPRATFVLQRPYCPGCKSSVAKRVLTCAFCGTPTRAKDGFVRGRKFYCEPCDSSESAPPWKQLLKSDRRFPNHENLGVSAIESIADAA